MRPDLEKFGATLASGKFAEKARRDFQGGVRIGIHATPTVFVDWRRVSEMTYESLKAAIEVALKAPAKK